MRWTVRLEARADQGEVKTTEVVTIERSVVDGTLADIGLALSEAKVVLTKLQASMVQSQGWSTPPAAGSARDAGCSSA